MNTYFKSTALVKSALLATTLFIPIISFSADTVDETTTPLNVVEKSNFEEIVVTAEFRDVNLLDTGNSISVVDSETIHRRGAQYLEQVLNLVPNVNFSSGASRGRFFQIRGIGERSQFIEPVNPSVGILIDGIDFSGIGGAATTLDVQQIEILRGPQGTLFGANALAGLIDMKSNDPSESFEGNFETSFAEYETRTVSGVISGPVTDNLGYRLAVQQHKSDGYVENDFLNRDDTNNIDEQTIRGKLHWQVNDELEVKFTGFYLDADNGYDSFSLDNNRHTLSDQPGHDRQESTAFAVESIWRGAEQFDVISQIGYAESNLEYSYDEDWTFTDICSGQPCDGWAYTSFDNYLRDRETKTVDLRLVSNDQGMLFNETTDWVLGVYYRDQEESLLREYTFNSGDFISDFDTKNYAIYGQLGSQLTDNLRLTSGLRLEYRSADYWDSDGVNNDKGERLWGGRLGLEYHITDNTMVYGLVSRGYKAGGVNSDPVLDDDYRTFGTERMWNFETGIKGDWFDGVLQTQLALFYQKRTKMQVKQSLVECPPGPGSCTFTDYLDNAEKGANYGAELEFTWLASDVVQVYGSLGLLRATFKDYETFNHVDVDRSATNPVPKDLSGHEQAHAPSYQFAIGTEVALTRNLTAGLEVEGKESFYLSPRHNAKTNRYELVNARLNYRLADWEVSLWGRNLADRDVIVRGFGSFGNDPRQCPDPSTPSSCYPVEPYYQYGEPRIVGATAKYRF